MSSQASQVEVPEIIKCHINHREQNVEVYVEWWSNEKLGDKREFFKKYLYTFKKYEIYCGDRRVFPHVELRVQFPHTQEIYLEIRDVQPSRKERIKYIDQLLNDPPLYSDEYMKEWRAKFNEKVKKLNKH